MAPVKSDMAVIFGTWSTMTVISDLPGAFEYLWTDYQIF